MKKALISLLSFAALAAATPVSVTYVNAGSPSVTDSDHDFVGPYTLNIGGHNVQAMCVDDFYNTSGTWSANVTAVTSNNLSNTYLGNHNFTIDGIQFASSTLYLDEAYLYSQIIKPGADRIHIQDAAWTLMDYATGHWPHTIGDIGVDNVLADLATNISSFDASGYEILSQVNHGFNAEQEFIFATPEPASCGLLGGALLLLGLTRVWSKRSKRLVSSL